MYHAHTDEKNTDRNMYAIGRTQMSATVTHISVIIFSMLHYVIHICPTESSTWLVDTEITLFLHPKISILHNHYFPFTIHLKEARSSRRPGDYISHNTTLKKHWL